MTVTISEQARAMGQLELELQQVEKLQLEVGEEIAALLFKQVQLAEKCRAILNTMKLIKELPDGTA